MIGHSYSLSFPILLFFRSPLHCSRRFLRIAKREGRVSSLETQIAVQEKRDFAAPLLEEIPYHL
jgi:hypothetical protein